MDPNHHSELLTNSKNEIKPTCVPFEHWIPDKDGNHVKLCPGHVFDETTECKDFKSKKLMPLNNHTRKKGIECATTNSKNNALDKHGTLTSKKHLVSSKKRPKEQE